MKKIFCDICESPADDKLEAEIVRPIGKEYVGIRNGIKNSLQCQVVARVVFTFRDHPSGFGGPPDLCRKCAGLLLNDLRVRFEDGIGMAAVRQQATAE